MRYYTQRRHVKRPRLTAVTEQVTAELAGTSLMFHGNKTTRVVTVGNLNDAIYLHRLTNDLVKRLEAMGDRPEIGETY